MIMLGLSDEEATYGGDHCDCGKWVKGELRKEVVILREMLS